VLKVKCYIEVQSFILIIYAILQQECIITADELKTKKNLVTKLCSVFMVILLFK